MRAQEMGKLMEVSTDQLRQAVEGQHGGKAVLVDALPVKELFEGKTVWEGIVHVTWRTIPRPRAPMRGRLRSRAATGAGSTPCCIWAGSGRRWMRCERLSWRNIA